jgi:transposase
MRYLGVDLHTNSFTVCFRAETGREKIKTYAMKRLLDFLFDVEKKDIVAVESTGNTRFFVESICKSVKKVIVVDPNKFDVIKKSTKKTDKNDARMLALFLSKEMVPEARMKTGLQAEIGKLVATRHTLVEQRTALINTIHNLLNAQGIKEKKEMLTTVKGLQRVLSLSQEEGFDELVCVQLEVLTAQITMLNQGIKKLEEQMVDKGKQLKGHENLSSIKGIGDKAATILLSVIGDISDFEDEGKLASYFGMVPRVQCSNDTKHYGRITKRGSKIGRTTMVQCALVAIRYNKYLYDFYSRIKQRRGSGKAIIATARKLLGIVYETLTNNWVFTDFPNFKYVTA